MIKYKNGTIDERQVVSIYNWGIYDNVIALMYDEKTDTFEELKLCGYFSSGCCDPIEKVINNLSKIESIDYNGVDLKLLEKFLEPDYQEMLENIKAEFNNVSGEYEFKKGDLVEVFKGRKYKIGIQFKIQKFDYYSINYYNGVMYAIGKIDGSWVKVDCKNIRLVDREKLIENKFVWEKEMVINKLTSLLVNDDYNELESKINKG